MCVWYGMWWSEVMRMIRQVSVELRQSVNAILFATGWPDKLTKDIFKTSRHVVVTSR